jgi:DNA-binding beta-propeller fold protein YncE
VVHSRRAQERTNLIRESTTRNLERHYTTAYEYLYVANRGSASNNFSGSISAFALDPDNGSLTTMSSTSVGIEPRAIVADPSGKTIYVVNHGSHDIWSFNINRQNGALSFTKAARTRTGPASVAITAGIDSVVVSPILAYAVGAGASAVGAYSVDPSTGVLSETGGSPFGTADASILVAIHPSGRFLYVGNYWSYKLSGYSIDPNSGILTPVPGSPYSFPSAPFMVLPDPSGRFLYMTNSYDVLHAMAINPVTGALAAVPWGPVKMSHSSAWGLPVSRDGSLKQYSRFSISSNRVYVLECRPNRQFSVRGP